MYKKIYIGLSRPKNESAFFSLFVRYGETLERFLMTGKWNLQSYSHILVRWFSETADADVAYEASGHGLRFLGPKAFDHKIHPIKWYCIELYSHEEYEKLLKFCMTYAGTDYGFRQIFGIVIVKTAKIYHYWLNKIRVKLGLKTKTYQYKNPFWDQRKTQVCLETGGYILNDIKEMKLAIDLESSGVRDFDEEMQRLCEMPYLPYVYPVKEYGD